MSGGAGAARALRIAARLAWLAVGGALLVLFVFYVWPTAYRYDHMTDEGEIRVVRIDRITGDADVLMPDQGWVPVEDPGDAAPGDGSGPT